jgi:hypothetical protein
MSLTVRLDDQEEARLQQLVETLKADSQSSLIRQLILEKWNSLQCEKTFVERRGGHPAHLLEGESNASQRAVRKKRLEERFAEKAAGRKGRDNAQSVD